MSNLYFGLVGDTRPGTIDEDGSYPTPIIQQIFQDLQTAGVEFVVATGDYQFATPTGNDGATQLQDYATAMSAFSGKVFPAMGNHECDGETNDNCSSSGEMESGSNSGEMSNNFAAFQSTLLNPIGQTLPYYTLNFNITGTTPPSTTKIIFIACNAWDSTQSSWLSSQLAIPTTHTIIVRHENDDPTADALGPCQDSSQGTTSESIIAAASTPPDVILTGHTHTFAFDSTWVVAGNGGAPLDNPMTEQYGYAIVSLNGGAVFVQEYDYNSATLVNEQTYIP